MPGNRIDKLLTRLDETRGRFGSAAGRRAETLLAALARLRIDDPTRLIRFHETLLFLLAFPHNAKVLEQVRAILDSFHRRVEHLRESDADLIEFDYIEHSGIAGTSISGTFSFNIIRWLTRLDPRAVRIDWERYNKGERLGSTLPRFLPLLSEESLVEANIPYRQWLETGVGSRRPTVRWLVNRFDQLPLTHREKAELYDSLELPIRWDLVDSAFSRSRLARRVRRVFYHKGPMLQRRDVSLADEMDRHPGPVEQLSRSEGEKILDMVRQATTVRYRELYGITNGDPGTVSRIAVGRGIEIFLWGLPPAHRLPLRGYNAGFTLKNGVPVNYIEAITLFERTEVGFNTFYTFRDGETAWVYACVLRILRQLLNVLCVSLDPYQIGFNNDEAVESGAFWFYRKLGFRPTEPELLRLTEAEERRISLRPGYRTPAKVLRQLSRGPMLFEAPGARKGEWDRFRVRNLGLAVQRRMAKEFSGKRERIQAASSSEVAAALGLNPELLDQGTRLVFDDFSLVMGLIPDLADWTTAEKKQVHSIMRAKAGHDESRYLKLLQSHSKLRSALRILGSAS
jgi:hypothetical protein